MQQFIIPDLVSALTQGIIDTDEYLMFLGYYYEMVAAEYAGEREGK